MDILLDAKGDLCISPKGDIILEESVAQKINIRLRWMLGEWRWNRENGLPYFEHLLIKNPDIDYFESLIRSAIFEIDEVTEVRSVSITFDSKTRDGLIRYVALTDFDTIKEEVRIKCQSTE